MKEILQRLEACYQQAEEHFARPFRRPEVRLDLRGQKAGVAYLDRHLLRFNAGMYARHQADFLQQTVPHEAAHLIAHSLYGRHIRPHGAEWQGIMRDVFNLPAQRCHNYSLPARRTTEYLYRCACPDLVHFTPQRHRWVLKGRRYQCLRCSQPLHFTGQARQRQHQAGIQASSKP